MGGTKRGSKGGSHPNGFFQLFDRSGKSNWKKLFSAMSATSEQNHGRLDEEKLKWVDDHTMEYEKQSKASYASSTVDDDEGNGVKAPSVVARLMGLDFLPNDDMVESRATTPFHDSRFTQGPKKSLQFGYECQNLYSEKQSNSRENFPQKMLEPRSQNLQKLVVLERRPIGRFQTENPPTKPIKSFSDIQHRLLSPIKNSGFVSAKNASHLMEAAVKIIEPRLTPATKVKKTFVSTISVGQDNEPEGRSCSYSITKPFEISKKLSEPNAVKILKEQAMNKSCNVSSFRTSSDGRLSKEVCSMVDQITIKSSPKVPFISSKPDKLIMLRKCANSEDKRDFVARNQGKSVSLAIQAKVNVQKRGNVSGSTVVPSTSASSLIIHDEQDEPIFGRPRKTQLHLQKHKQKHATAATNILRQNNQKHNRSSSKPSGSNQVARKDVVSRTPSGPKSTSSRDCRVSVRNYRKQTMKETHFKTSDRGINDIETGASSSRDGNFPRKKRLIEGGFHVDSDGLSDFAALGGDKSLDGTNMTNTNCVGQNQCNKPSSRDIGHSSKSKSTDVVSFTFTSPLLRSSGSLSSVMPPLDKLNAKRGDFVDSCGVKNAMASKSSSTCSSDSMMLEGDVLSALLEKKLKELSSGIQMSDSLKTTKSGGENTLPILQDFLTTLNSGSSAFKECAAECRSVPKGFDMVYGSTYKVGISSSSAKSPVKERNSQHSFQSQRGDFLKLDGQEYQDHLSPVSILDTAFSNDCSNSSDTSDGGQLEHSCQPSASVSTTTERELSDSATSLSTASFETPGVQDLRYIRDIMRNTSLVFEDIAVEPTNKIINPLLFNKLESNFAIYRTVDTGESRNERKLLFDAVGEYVDLKFSHCNTGDWRSWKKAIALIERRDGLAEDIHKDMLQWRGVGESMVDEIVDRDMSTGLGRWMNFDKEEIETGLEIEHKILDSLIEDVVGDILGC